jgi:hypothetical protein
LPGRVHAIEIGLLADAVFGPELITHEYIVICSPHLQPGPNLVPKRRQNANHVRFRQKMSWLQLSKRNQITYK